MEEKLLSYNQIILFILLIKVGVISALATLLIRTQLMKNLLFRKPRRTRENLVLTSILAGFLALGVLFRLVLRYHAIDLSLAGTIVSGLLMGPLYGVITGCIAAFPALVKGEILAFPFGIFYGLTSGMMRYRFKNKEEIWEFSPFQPINTFQLARETSWLTALRNPRTQTLILCLVLESIRMVTVRVVGLDYMFALIPTNPGVILSVLIGTVICVGIPLKIWNNTRLEIKLKDREKQLLKSRYEILRSQINPHFLFNTLNSITSLIRTNPAKARDIVMNLSSVLRTILKEKRDLVTVKDELDLIEKYLYIEKSRFGEDRLEIITKIDHQVEEVLIPAMMVQPIVENAIKHGISKKIGGGAITIKIKKDQDKVLCQVSDNGLGAKVSREKSFLENGIGLNNIKGRLEMVYGTEFDFDIHSEINRGTTVTIRVPMKPLFTKITE